MELINTGEIKKRIAELEKEIARLNQLLELSASFGGPSPRGRRAAAAEGKPAGRRPRRGKRGAVSSSILEVLGSSSKALTAGDVRDKLIEKGVVKKGSTTVATLMFQMTRKGILKKAKSANGVVYSMDSKKSS